MQMLQAATSSRIYFLEPQKLEFRLSIWHPVNQTNQTNQFNLPRMLRHQMQRNGLSAVALLPDQTGNIVSTYLHRMWGHINKQRRRKSNDISANVTNINS